MRYRSVLSLLLVAALCLVGNSGWSQIQKVRFEHLTIHDGLPENSGRSILQDHLGFLWFGTQDGLVKYDGFSCEVFRAGDHGMPFNYIYDLFIDSKNRLWMSSNADYRGVAH